MSKQPKQEKVIVADNGDFYNLGDDKEAIDVINEGAYDMGDDENYIEVEPQEEELPAIPKGKNEEDSKEIKVPDPQQDVVQVLGDDDLGVYDNMPDGQMKDAAPDDEEEIFGFDDEEELETVTAVKDENQYTPDQASDDAATASLDPSFTPPLKLTAEQQAEIEPLNRALRGIATVSPMRKAFRQEVNKDKSPAEALRKNIADFNAGKEVAGVKKGQDTLCDNFMKVANAAAADEDFQDGDALMLTGMFNQACKREIDTPCSNLSEIERVGGFLQGIRDSEIDTPVMNNTKVHGAAMLEDFQEEVTAGYAAAMEGLSAKNVDDAVDKDKEESEKQQDATSQDTGFNRGDMIKQISRSTAQIALVASVMSTGGIGIVVAAAVAAGIYYYNMKKGDKENKKQYKERIRAELEEEFAQKAPGQSAKFSSEFKKISSKTDKELEKGEDKAFAKAKESLSQREGGQDAPGPVKRPEEEVASETPPKAENQLDGSTQSGVEKSLEDLKEASEKLAEAKNLTAQASQVGKGEPEPEKTQEEGVKKEDPAKDKPDQAAKETEEKKEASQENKDPKAKGPKEDAPEKPEAKNEEKPEAKNERGPETNKVEKPGPDKRKTESRKWRNRIDPNRDSPSKEIEGRS